MKCPIAPTRESGASLTTPMRYALDNLSALITLSFLSYKFSVTIGL